MPLVADNVTISSVKHIKPSYFCRSLQSLPFSTDSESAIADVQPINDNLLLLFNSRFVRFCVINSVDAYKYFVVGKVTHLAVLREFSIPKVPQQGMINSIRICISTHFILFNITSYNGITFGPYDCLIIRIFPDAAY